MRGSASGYYTKIDIPTGTEKQSLEKIVGITFRVKIVSILCFAGSILWIYLHSNNGWGWWLSVIMSGCVFFVSSYDYNYAQDRLDGVEYHDGDS